MYTRGGTSWLRGPCVQRAPFYLQCASASHGGSRGPTRRGRAAPSLSGFKLGRLRVASRRSVRVSSSLLQLEVAAQALRSRSERPRGRWPGKSDSESRAWLTPGLRARQLEDPTLSPSGPARGPWTNLGRLPLRVFSIGKHAFQKKAESQSESRPRSLHSGQT
jgi:hypothetical protein